MCGNPRAALPPALQIEPKKNKSFFVAKVKVYTVNCTGVYFQLTSKSQQSKLLGSFQNFN